MHEKLTEAQGPYLESLPSAPLQSQDMQNRRNLKIFKRGTHNIYRHVLHSTF